VRHGGGRARLWRTVTCGLPAADETVKQAAPTPHPEDEKKTRLGLPGCDRGSDRTIRSSGVGKELCHTGHLPRGETQRDRLRREPLLR
jgi:hypothetical protein